MSNLIIMVFLFKDWVGPDMFQLVDTIIEQVSELNLKTNNGYYKIKINTH